MFTLFFAEKIKLPTRLIALMLVFNMAFDSLLAAAAKPVFAWAATLPDNPFGETVDIGAGDDMVNNWGTIGTNDGELHNNAGTVIENNGVVDDNWGTVSDNNAQPGTVGVNHDDGTVNGGNITENFGTANDPLSVSNNYSSGSINFTSDFLVANSTNDYPFVNNNHGNVSVNGNTDLQSYINDHLLSVDGATGADKIDNLDPPAQPAPPTPFDPTEPEEQSDDSTPQITLTNQQLAIALGLSADAALVLSSNAAMNKNTMYLTLSDGQSISVVNLGAETQITATQLKAMMKHGGKFGFLSGGYYYVIDFSNDFVRDTIQKLFNIAPAATGTLNNNDNPYLVLNANDVSKANEQEQQIRDKIENDVKGISDSLQGMPAAATQAAEKAKAASEDAKKNQASYNRQQMVNLASTAQIAANEAKATADAADAAAEKAKKIAEQAVQSAMAHPSPNMLAAAEAAKNAAEAAENLAKATREQANAAQDAADVAAQALGEWDKLKTDDDDDDDDGGDVVPGTPDGFAGLPGSVADVITLTPVGSDDSGGILGARTAGRRSGNSSQDRGVAGVRVDDNRGIGDTGNQVGGVVGSQNETVVVGVVYNSGLELSGTSQTINNTGDGGEDNTEKKLNKVETPDKPLAATPFYEDPVNPAIVGISIASLLAVLAGLYYEYNRRMKARAEEKKYKKN